MRDPEAEGRDFLLTSCRPARSCRYDNKASDLTAAGMKDGVSKTGCFLLFLSAGVMRRPYVQVAYRGSFVARALHCVAI